MLGWTGNHQGITSNDWTLLNLNVKLGNIRKCHDWDHRYHSAPSCNRFGHNGKKTIIILVTKIAVKVSCQFGKVPLAV